MSAADDRAWYRKHYYHRKGAPRGEWDQRRPRAATRGHTPGAKKFLKVAAQFCERAAVEGNLKTWEGKGIFVQRCVERVVRSLAAVAAAKRGRR
jgi:hypothetical protein